MQSKFQTSFLVIIMLLLLFNITMAQDKPLRFGALVGPQLTLTNVSMEGDLEPKYAAAFGGVVEYWFSPNIAIRTNILYNMKGFKFADAGSFMSIDYDWSFNYLSIPIHPKFAFGERTKFFIFLGPELSFLLSADLNVNADLMGTNVINVGDDISEHISSFEVAFNLGMGVDIPIQNMVLFIQWGGSISLTDIYKDKNWRTDDYVIMLEEGTAVNGVANLQLGILF